MKEVGEKLKSFFSIAGSSQKACLAMVSSIVTSVLCYFLLMVNGNTNPDGIIEGLHYYHNADVASQGGRWAVRYLVKIVQNNIVIPHLIIVIYSCCVAVSVIILCKLWNIGRISVVVLLSAIMVATPAVIVQLTYIHMGICYSFAFLLSVAFVYLCYLGGIKNYLGCMCLTVSLGLYQSYIGVAVLVSIITIVLMLIDGERVGIILRTVAKFSLIGIISLVLDYLIMILDLKLHDLAMQDRVEGVSVTSILKNLPETAKGTYRSFVIYFDDYIMRRDLWYLFLLAAGIIFLFIALWQKNRKRWRRWCVVAFLLLICPLGANIIQIIVLYKELSGTMSYQMVIMIPFVFSLMERINFARFYTKIAEVLCYGSTIMLVYSFVISANATFKCYQISYNCIQIQMEQAISDIYKLSDFEVNKTPILIAGFPNDKEVRSIPLYNYCIGMTENVAFWEIMLGAMGGRYWYFKDFMGIDSQWFTYDEYTEIVSSKEFKEMPTWPRNGSVQMMNGIAVIKFSDDPPIP